MVRSTKPKEYTEEAWKELHRRNLMAKLYRSLRKEGKANIARAYFRDLKGAR